MRDNVLKIISHEYPEIKSKLHLPIFCQVVDSKKCVTGVSTRQTPKHCVTAQLLNDDLTINTNIPLLEDVPVVMPFAGEERGLATLPQKGAICEICFAYGKLTLPFIRSILPYNLKLPEVKNNAIKIQHNAQSYINLAEKEIETISETIKSKSKELLQIGEKIHLGTEANNFLKIVSDFMASTATALGVLATHNHPYINVAAPATTSPNAQGGAISEEQGKITSLKGTLDAFTK